MASSKKTEPAPSSTSPGSDAQGASKSEAGKSTSPHSSPAVARLPSERGREPSRANGPGETNSRQANSTPSSAPSNSARPNSAQSNSAQSGQVKDVVLVHGVTEDRKGLRVLRAREKGVEFGEVRPVVEGQPITSDLVRLRPRPDAPFICDVETEYSVPRPSQDTVGRSGPAQVATQAYRDNWDAIWAHNGMSAPDSSKLN